MAIFLGILKIIGLVLLIFLGVLVGMVVYLLIFPYWFMVAGEFDDEMVLKAAFTSFLHFLQVRLSYASTTNLQFSITIFGTALRIYPPKEKKEKQDSSSDEATDSFAKSVSLKNEEDSMKETISSQEDDFLQEKTADHIKDNIKDNTIDKSEEKIKEKPFARGKKKSKNKKETHTKDNIFLSVKEKIHTISSAYKEGRFKESVSYLIKQLIRLIKSMKLHLKGTDIVFSAGEPDVTGKVTGILSCFPFIYDTKVKILPDFTAEEVFLKGKLILHGQIRLINFVILVFRVIFNKDCRAMLRCIGGKKNGK